MPIMVKGKKSILFVHIPKCGGSTFEGIMANMGWRELLSIRGMHSSKLSFMRCSPQHMHAEQLMGVVNPKHFNHIIALVRDPLSRLKSEYAWQRRQSITGLSPEEWVEFVFSEFRKDPFVYDNHIRPQSEFLIEGVGVFKLENDGINQALKAVEAFSGDEEPGLNNTNRVHLKRTKKGLEIHEGFKNKLVQIQDFYGRDYENLNYDMQSQ